MNQVKSMWCHTLFLAQRYLVPICSMAQWMWSLHDPPYFSEGFISRQQETRSGFWQVPQWQVHPHPLMKQHLDTKTSLLCDVPFQKRGIRFYSPPTLKRGWVFFFFFCALARNANNEGLKVPLLCQGSDGSGNASNEKEKVK